MKKYGYTMDGLENWKYKKEYEVNNSYNINKIINGYNIHFKIKSYETYENITYDTITRIDNCDSIKLIYVLQHYNKIYYTKIECCIYKETLSIIIDKIEDELVNLAWSEYAVILMDNGIIPDKEYSNRQEFNRIVNDWQSRYNYDIWDNVNGVFAGTFEIYEPEFKYLQEKHNKECKEQIKEGLREVNIKIDFKDEVRKIKLYKKNAKKIIDKIKEDYNNDNMIKFDGCYWNKRILEKIYVIDENNKEIEIDDL